MHKLPKTSVSPTNRSGFPKLAIFLGMAVFVLFGCGGAADGSSNGITVVPSDHRMITVADPVALPELDVPLFGDELSKMLERPVVSGRQRSHAQQSSLLPPLAIDTQDREAVRNFYNGLYGQSDGVAMQWSGNYDSNVAGTVSPSYQEATVLRINWFRAMAGVPGDVSLSSAFSIKDQQAALMMSVNQQLSHFPPSTWRAFTPDGYEAAGQSNLNLGSSGAEAVSGGYMRDAGANNSAAGHRRWLLYPQLKMVGTGDVPGGTSGGVKYSPANAIWVLDGQFGAPRPAVRDNFVAWPPKGFVPYQAVYGRWSFSLPAADFSTAKISVTRNGTSVPVTVEPPSNGIGENTVVWLLAGSTDATTAVRPTKDEDYVVTVSDITLAGKLQTFSYKVTVFDPSQPQPGAMPTTVAVQGLVQTGTSFQAAVTPLAGATGFEVAAMRRLPVTAPLDGGNPQNRWTASTSAGYSPFEAGAFHLYHFDSQTQRQTLNDQLLIHSGAKLTVDKSVGYATPAERFKIEISVDDGSSWSDLFMEYGTNGPTPKSTVSVDLSQFSERLVRLRFTVDFANGSSYYNSPNSGWTFNNIKLVGADVLSNETRTVGNLSNGTALLSIAMPGDYVVAARTQFQNRYYSAYGQPAYVQATPSLTDDQALLYIASYGDLISSFGTNLTLAKQHYADVGFKEGRVISFEPLSYIASYPDLLAYFKMDGVAATYHYILSGYGEGRVISFDPLRYISSYPDLIKLFGANSLAGVSHYINNGFNEGRTTSFDVQRYEASYPDLITTFGSDRKKLLTHYLTTGFYEGRTPTFDALRYIASYGDLIKAFFTDIVQATRQFLDSGFAEKRAPTFDSYAYFYKYKDLAAAFGNDKTRLTTHFINSGYFEGRNDQVPPTAGISVATDVLVQSNVGLDGTLSNDFYGLPLTYAWTILKKPISSAATLFAPTSGKPSFVADAPGTYLIGLVVNNGKSNSPQFTTSITASTPLQGTISTNTRLTANNSPYAVTSLVQVTNGITLSVDPGVVIKSNGFPIKVFGNFDVLGTAASHIKLIDLVISNQGVSDGQASNIKIGYADISGGSIMAPTGQAIYSSISITDSIFDNVNQGTYIYLWYPVKDCVIERNIFRSSGGFKLLVDGRGIAKKIFIRNNVFFGVDGIAVEDLASYGGETAVVAGNSFLDTGKIVLSLPAGYNDAAMTAVGNYWGTVNTTDIQTRIYDKSKDLGSAGYVVFSPVISQPDAATPKLQ